MFVWRYKCKRYKHQVMTIQKAFSHDKAIFCWKKDVSTIKCFNCLCRKIKFQITFLDNLIEKYWSLILRKDPWNLNTSVYEKYVPEWISICYLLCQNNEDKHILGVETYLSTNNISCVFCIKNIWFQTNQYLQSQQYDK